MKKLILLLLVAHNACKNPNNKLTTTKTSNTPQDTAITSDLIKTATPFDKELEAIIDSVVNTIYHLDKIQQLSRTCKISILTQEPENPDSAYCFKVGFNGADRFETRYNFSFKKSESIIFYYDVVNDELIDIDKWNKQ
jgi:hypothetical protein